MAFLPERVVGFLRSLPGRTPLAARSSRTKLTRKCPRKGGQSYPAHPGARKGCHRRPGGGAGCQDVVNEQDIGTVQPGCGPGQGCEGVAHVGRPLSGVKGNLGARLTAPHESLRKREAGLLGESAGQHLRLIEAPDAR